jgi:hypothetical protein
MMPNRGLEFITFLDKKKLNIQIRVILKGEVWVICFMAGGSVFLFCVSD